MRALPQTSLKRHNLLKTPRLAALAMLLVLIFAGCFVAEAQRRVTPVGEPKALNLFVPDSTGRAPAHVHDTDGNVVLIDTITGVTDTIFVQPKKVSKMIYPLIYNLSVGVDIWDPVMRILGQHYGLGSAWTELNMHNRYFPYLEFGLSRADDTPDDRNFTFRSPMSPFFKIGASYNIFYNSNPDYQLKFGLRYGFTPFKYEITDVTVDEGYWQEPSHFNIPQQSATAGYLEIVAAIKVKIWRNLSMGWALKFHSLLHQSASPMGKPMIIPGYGKRNGSFTGAFSVIYTLPLNKPTTPNVDNSVPGDKETRKSN